MSTSKNITDKSFTFYTRTEYYEQLAELIAQTKKGDRVALATMSFEPSEPVVGRITNELCAAAKRGVKVRCMIDAMSFMLSKDIVPGPLFYSRKLDTLSAKPFSRKYQLLEKLAESGGEYTITNRPARPFSLPFAGRSHMKFAVINNDVYVGGCNLKETDRTDLMVHWHNSTVADWLFTLADTVHSKNHVSAVLEQTDLTMPLDDHTTLLVDAGVKNQSVIFKNALRVIDEAEDYIVMACQYFPNDVTVQGLSKAVARGVNVRLIYNHPGNHSFPMNLLHFAVRTVEKRRNPSILFSYELSKKHDFMHAKLLATEKACLVGSHNFVRAGVKFGTAEIALLNTDPDFTRRAVSTLERQL